MSRPPEQPVGNDGAPRSDTASRLQGFLPGWRMAVRAAADGSTE